MIKIYNRFFKKEKNEKLKKSFKIVIFKKKLLIIFKKSIQENEKNR